MIRSGIVPPDRFARAVETIERNATSLTQIVEDILDVSRIISGKLRLAMQPVDIPDIARHAIEAIAPTAHAKGIQLESHVDPDVSPVSADPERLQQVVWNLLSNAVKFTGRGGAIELRIGDVDGQVEISVRDTGIGITPEFLPHLFERFRQADASTTREHGGLGLGLSIARQLVEMHGGTIDAASEGAGRGSTFRVRLPAIAPADAHDDEPVMVRIADDASAARLPELHGVRVLAVDDDRDALQMLREILQSAGAHVSTADSAQAALDAIDAVHPDVLVSDVGMPRMDGFDLIARIRSSPKAAVRGLPAVAVTAYARSEDRARALRAGYQMHLSKPIDPAELLAAVASLGQRTPSR
jgi:CheY-like chemotaxis protein/anti-sigma regulatory factor (Ser/Thr protein kinase)